MPALCVVFSNHSPVDLEMRFNSDFDAYCNYLENLTLRDLSRLGDFVEKDVQFSDPFHDVRGINEMAVIFSKLFSTTSNITFSVMERSNRESIYFFRWKLTGTLRNQPWIVEGVTLLQMSENGKVISHREFWDAASQFYERLPVIGPLLRILRRRIATT